MFKSLLPGMELQGDVYYCQKTDTFSIMGKSFHGVLNSNDNGNLIISCTASRDSVDHATNARKIIANNGICILQNRSLYYLLFSKRQ